MKQEVFRAMLGSEFVGSTINHWFANAKIAGRRRGWDGPFECGGAPRILILGFVAAPQSPGKIEEEESLGGDGENRGDGHKSTERRAQWRC